MERSWIDPFPHHGIQDLYQPVNKLKWSFLIILESYERQLVYIGFPIIFYRVKVVFRSGSLQHFDPTPVNHEQDPFKIGIEPVKSSKKYQIKFRKNVLDHFGLIVLENTLLRDHIF